MRDQLALDLSICFFSSNCFGRLSYCKMSMGQNLSPFSSKSASPSRTVTSSLSSKLDSYNMGAEASRLDANGTAIEDGSAQGAVSTIRSGGPRYGTKEPLDKKILKQVALYTPLRLTDEERVLLGVVEGALDHSEFTSNVDVSSSMHYVRETYDKDDRVEKEVSEFCCVLLGLSGANDFKTRGRETLGNRLQDREEFFQSCLEIGRRFKILNPGKWNMKTGFCC